MPNPLPGDAIIDLGVYGKLIAPVQVDGGHWYYLWDKNSNGSVDINDYLNHKYLDSIFVEDANGVTRSDPYAGTTDTFRYATINGIKLALPTINGGSFPSDAGNIPNIFVPGPYPYGTSIGSSAGDNTVNAKYSDLLAIWDAYNGTSTTKSYSLAGIPSGWPTTTLSATQGASQHYYLDFSNGSFRESTSDYSVGYVILELVDIAPPLLTSTLPIDNTSAALPTSDLTFTFNELVVVGAGNVTITNLSNPSDSRIISIADVTQVSISGQTVTINLTADLLAGAHYAVTMVSGIVKDLTGNDFAGISSSTTLDFTTQIVADTPIEVGPTVVNSPKTKYFVLPSSTGANFTDFDLSYGSVTLTGEQVTFVGSSAVDAVFVRPGVTVDFTLSGSGADKIYLGGSFSSYTASISGSVMKLEHGSGSALESVSFIKSTSAASSDSIIFADGTLNSLDLYNNLKNSMALPALSTTETSIAPLAPALAGSLLNASIKAFALNIYGDTFAPSHPGVAMTVVGSMGVDTVYVSPGGVVDCTLLGSGHDLIYFTGNWGDYTKAISGSVLTFGRTVDGYNESVKVVGSSTNISLNDHLVFADGAVYSGDAKTALTASLLAEISSVSGYDATMKTLLGASTSPVISA